MNGKHVVVVVSAMLISAPVIAKNIKGCPVTHDQLSAALTAAQAQNNGDLSLDMWATVVTKEGKVCAVAKTGAKLADQWLASRVISAQKAYTAMSLSNNKGSSATTATQSFGFTSAGLYLATQPGGSLYGLQHSNPVDTKFAYAGSSSKFGTANDPMLNKYVGGVNVFGGGLPLFDANGQVIGGLGVSGNTSCADHNIAWRIRGSFADDGLAQGAGIEVGIDYAGGYPSCDDGAKELWYSDIMNISQYF
ncbi:heme-binding protein [Methylomonas sp. MgM2]